MDFLNKTFAQLADLFKSMTPGARLTAGMLLVVIVVSLGYLFKYQASGADAYLMGGEAFSSAQLNAMEAAFAKANLNAYEIEGNRVRVPRGQQAAYMGALADGQAMPADFGKYLERARDAGGPFQSRDQREQAYKIAVQNELQGIIRKMRGIENASVLYTTEEKVPFGRERRLTASVSVQPQGTQSLDPERVPVLRNLVASAIGTKPENVTVIDLNGGTYAGGGNASDSLGLGEEDQYAARKRRFESDWTDKILNHLSYIPNVRVAANVELDTEIGHEETTIQYDAKAVASTVEETSTTKTMKGPLPSGRPGLGSQGGVNEPASVGTSAGPENNEETTQNRVTSKVPETSKRIVYHPLVPKRVTVSIGVPSSYYEKIWQKDNPPVDGQPPQKPDPATLTQIETRVKKELEDAIIRLIPHEAPTQDPFPRVQVTTFQQLPEPPLPGPSFQENALAWLGQYWSTLGMTGLALASLVMLRSMVKSTNEPTPPAPTAAPTLSMPPDDAEEEQEETSPRSRLRRRGATGPSLRDELAELVREDPDGAVSILRNWISSAS